MTTVKDDWTSREIIAVEAMKAMLSNSEITDNLSTELLTYVARAAYEMADIMLGNQR